MRNLIKIGLVAAAAVAGASFASGAAGSSEPMFLYFYYSDASKTTQVGFRRDICTNGYVTSGPVQGQITPYFDIEGIGRCPGYLY